MEDKDFLEGLRRSDLDTLAGLIDHYSPYVFSVVRNQLGRFGNEADVEEIASEVFFILWQKRFTFKSTHLRGWLGIVSRNQARSFQRKNKKYSKEISIEDVFLVEGEQSEKLLEQKERTRILWIALQELGEPDSTILTLFYYDDLSVPSIATRLQMHPEAIKSKIRRGREKIKSILRREGYEV